MQDEIFYTYCINMNLDGILKHTEKGLICGYLGLWIFERLERERERERERDNHSKRAIFVHAIGVSLFA